MKSFIALLALFLAAGCVEIYKGPRVVRYVETDRFYVRHIPMFSNTENSSTQVAELASGICDEDGKTAELLNTEQFYFFDIRYSTFACK